MLDWFERHNWISLIVAVLIAGFIFYMSSRVFPPSVVGIGIKAIVYHFVVFFFLAGFLIAGLKGERKDVFWILVAVIIAVFYAVTDEFHQLFVPGRFGCLEDVLIDGIGVVCSGMVYGVLRFGK